MRSTLLSWLLTTSLFLGAAACGDDDAGGADGGLDAALPDAGPGQDAGPTGIRVWGHAFGFSLPGQPYSRIANAEVSILEAPEHVTTTDASGYFEFNDLTPGMEASFVLSATGFPEGQTKTFILPDTDLERVTFQIPPNDLYQVLAAVVGVTLDASRCQVVSTVTRIGRSIYDPGAHGEPEATVSSVPEIPAEQGPVYFSSDVIPTPSLTETSDDGGVLFTNVLPGEYVLSADKPGVSFESVTMKCRPGVLVNASPPHGLQAY